MAKDPTCEQRIDEHWQSTRETLRCYLDPQPGDIEVDDNGRLTINGEDINARHFFDLEEDDPCSMSPEGWAEFLEDTGELDAAREWGYERFHEYGLSFDYVEPEDGGAHYFRYQMSWGGPSDEMRFYINPDCSCYRIEYWFLDWFDGASRNVTKDEIAQLVWSQFEDHAHYTLDQLTEERNS